MDEARQCDRIAFINHGQVHGIDTPERILQKFASILCPPPLEREEAQQMAAPVIEVKQLTKSDVYKRQLVYWPSEEGHPQALEMLHNKEIDMVVNIPKNLTAGELDNGYKIRRAAIDLNVPLITNARLASAFINAFCTMTVDDIAIKSWEEYK